MVEYVIIFVMAVSGILTHFLKDMARIKQEEGKFIKPIQYWKDHPYQSLLSVIGTIVGIVVLHGMGELTYITAYGVGYMGNSVSDVVGKRGMGKLG